MARQAARCVSELGVHQSAAAGGTMRGTGFRARRGLSFIITVALFLNVLLPALTAYALPVISLPGGTISYAVGSGAVAIDSLLTVSPTPPNIQSATVRVDTNYLNGADVLS